MHNCIPLLSKWCTRQSMWCCTTRKKPAKTLPQTRKGKCQVAEQLLGVWNICIHTIVSPPSFLTTILHLYTVLHLWPRFDLVTPPTSHTWSCNMLHVHPKLHLNITHLPRKKLKIHPSIGNSDKFLEVGAQKIAYVLVYVPANLKSSYFLICNKKFSAIPNYFLKTPPSLELHVCLWTPSRPLLTQKKKNYSIHQILPLSLR